MGRLGFERSGDLFIGHGEEGQVDDGMGRVGQEAKEGRGQQLIGQLDIGGG